MTTPKTNMEVRNLGLALQTDLATIGSYEGKSPAVVLALLIEAERKMMTIYDYFKEVRTAAVDQRRAQAMEGAPCGCSTAEAGTDA